MTLDDTSCIELELDLIRDPGTQPPRLKLCADESVPAPFVVALRSAGIPVRTARDDGMQGRDDNAILAWARENDRILLTFDGDFWDEHKFPLLKSPGMIFVAVAAGRTRAALKAFWFAHDTLAVHLGNWHTMRIRAVSGTSCHLKAIGADGHRVDNQFYLKGDRVLVCGVRDRDDWGVG